MKLGQYGPDGSFMTPKHAKRTPILGVLAMVQGFQAVGFWDPTSPKQSCRAHPEADGLVATPRGQGGPGRSACLC